MSTSPDPGAPAPSTDPAYEHLGALRRAAARYFELEAMLRMAREERDGIALAAIDRGETWRAVADAAGFANPYIARLKKRRERAC